MQSEVTAVVTEAGYVRMVNQAALTVSVTPRALLYCFATCLTIVVGAWTLPARPTASAVTAPAARGNSSRSLSLLHSAAAPRCRQVLLPLDTRGKLATILESEQAHVGVEIGVQAGYFAETILRQWSHNTKYYLVDIWAPLTNYVDAANVGKLLMQLRRLHFATDINIPELVNLPAHVNRCCVATEQEEQDRIFRQAQENLKPYSNQTVFLKMTTLEGAEHIEDDSVDYIYVDARHDYCGVRQDLDAYWPKLKHGGILAGHDFVTNAELQDMSPDQDWSLCEDGTRNEAAVLGAVTDFAQQHSLQLSVTFREEFPTWFARKPC